MESKVRLEGAASPELLVYPDSRETEVGQNAASLPTDARERDYSTSQAISNLSQNSLSNIPQLICDRNMEMENLNSS